MKCIKVNPVRTNPHDMFVPGHRNTKQPAKIMIEKRLFNTHAMFLLAADSSKSSGHFPNFTTFIITMITISHTFQYESVLKDL